MVALTAATLMRKASDSSTQGNLSIGLSSSMSSRDTKRKPNRFPCASPNPISCYREKHGNRSIRYCSAYKSKVRLFNLEGQDRFRLSF